MDLYFSKESQKGPFKIIMQICADEWISLTYFYCLSVVFPSLGKKCLISPKTCKKLKYKMVGVINGLAYELWGAIHAE